MERESTREPQKEWSMRKKENQRDMVFWEPEWVCEYLEGGCQPSGQTVGSGYSKEWDWGVNGNFDFFLYISLICLPIEQM